MFDVALLPVNDIDQMLAHVFAGRNASDLICGVGQKGLELSTILALTSQVCWASPIGRWYRMLDRGRFELLADGDQPGHQLWKNRAELLPQSRYQRFQAGNLAIVKAEFVRRFLDGLNHVRQVFVTTASPSTAPASPSCDRKGVGNRYVALGLPVGTKSLFPASEETVPDTFDLPKESGILPLTISPLHRHAQKLTCTPWRLVA